MGIVAGIASEKYQIVQGIYILTRFSGRLPMMIAASASSMIFENRYSLDFTPDGNSPVEYLEIRVSKPTFPSHRSILS